MKLKFSNLINSEQIRNFVMNIFCCFLLLSCNSSPSVKINFSNPVRAYIKSERISLRKPFIVYYYNGNCSLCYVNIMNITNKLPKVPMIVITPTQDTVAINGYMGEIGYKGKVIVDTGAVFFNANQAILSNSKLLLIDSAKQVIAQSDDAFDEKTFRLFNQKVNQK